MSLDGAAVKAFLAAGLARLARGGSAGDRERQRSSFRALRAAEKAAAGQRPYGAALLSLFQGERQKHG